MLLEEPFQSEQDKLNKNYKVEITNILLMS
jgi:hypothetical protein